MSAFGSKTVVDSLNQLSQDQRKHKPQHSLELAEQAVQLSLEANNQEQLAYSLYNRGVVRMDFNQFIEARTDLDRAAEIFKGLNAPFFLRVNTDRATLLQRERKYPESLQLHLKNLKQGISGGSEYVPSILLNLGVVHYLMGNLDSAEFYYESVFDANDLVQKEKVKERIVYSNLAMIHRKRGQIKRALEAYFEVLPLAEAEDAKLHVANTHNSIGIAYYDLNECKKAVHHHMKALTLRKELENSQLVASSLNNIGLCYLRLEEPQQALDYFLQSLEIEQGLSGDRNISFMLNNIGLAYRQLGKLELSEKFHKQGLELDLERGYGFGIVRNRNNLAKVYLEMGRNAEALNILNQNYELAHKTGEYTGLSCLYKYSSEANEATGNYAAAYENLQKYNVLKDSLFTAQKAEQIAALTIEYETSEKEKILLEKEATIKELDYEKSIQKTRWNYLLAICGLVLLSSVLLISLIRAEGKRKRDELSKEKQLAVSRLASELDMNQQLNAQIEVKNNELRIYAEKLTQLGNGLDQAPLEEVAAKVKGRSASQISWEEFRLKFDQIHREFVPKLNGLHKDLTNNEIDVSILLKINLSNKDISNILGISYDGVKKSVQRLYKKLGFNNSQELRSYLTNI